MDRGRPPLLVEPVHRETVAVMLSPSGDVADHQGHSPRLALRHAISAALALADQQQDTLIAAMLDDCLTAAGGQP